ncbi:DUF1269 domain-containing protein [Candidatus Laterigemmans baculatus]|uniref:DUF1269 domain-containing protein n=1 Tax=Candidatus Laterigemmans baculatus TaxID=2770505 RepID=UPI0013DBC8F0|nr:DUF1269 domain-containing protein [Candidatus Laterigemmans baculatus]
MEADTKRECLIAEFQTREDARIGLEVLDTYDFTTASASVVAREAGEVMGDEAVQQLGRYDHQVEAAHSSGKGAGLGTLLGGVVAAPIAASTMVGPLFIAGPLAGMAVGAVAGAALGGAGRWGVNEESRRTYQQRVEAGSVLVIVTDEPDRVSQAEHGLKTTNVVNLERFSFSKPTAD